MGINEELKKKKEQEGPNQYVINLYKEQLKAITNISNTEGYKEIKRYWSSTVEVIKNKYPIVKQEDLHKLQVEDSIATSFLRFLENLEDAKNIEKLAKKK